jgi:hypothetical protein
VNGKAIIPAFALMAALLYCCWSVHHLRALARDSGARVEITFPETNGVVITPIERPDARH